MLNSPLVRAVVASVLFASVFGVLIAVGAFGAVRVVAQMGEGLGMLSSRWAEEHIQTMMIVSGVIALPVSVWFVYWFYRRALKAEIALQTYVYVPPAQTGGKP